MRNGRRSRGSAPSSNLPLSGVLDRRSSGGGPSRGTAARREPRSILWFLIPVCFGVRLMYDAYRQLVPDEAFYWLLSRHLAAGYLDHPPMVAYAIRAGTFLFGFNELGVRAIAAAAMGFGSLLVLVGACRLLLPGDDRAVFYLAIIWLVSPLLAALSTIVTPDTPVAFFSMCTLGCAVRIAVDEPGEDAPPKAGLKWWVLLGIFLGLALLSKYTAILPAIAIAGALLSSDRGRRYLRTPGPWVAVIVALLVFSPVIRWNAAHQWASFKFQLHHGMSNATAGDGEASATTAVKRLLSLGTYAAGQFGVWTPVLMVVGLVVVAKGWAAYRGLDLGRQLLVWGATVPLVFFALAALKSGFAGEANWPAFAYFPMSLLIVDDLHRDWKRVGVTWVRIGCGVALAITLCLHSPEMLYKLLGPKHFPRKLNEFFGWRELGRAVSPYAIGNAVIVAGRHQDAGELAFYMRGQPDVWCYAEYDAAGKRMGRPTAFDYMDDRPDLAKVEDVLYVGRQGHADQFARTYSFQTEAALIGSIYLQNHGEPRERTVVQLSKRYVITFPVGVPPATEPTTAPSHRIGSGKSVHHRPAATSATQPADTSAATRPTKAENH